MKVSKEKAKREKPVVGCAVWDLAYYPKHRLGLCVVFCCPGLVQFLNAEQRVPFVFACFCVSQFAPFQTK
jgi:hypothetical protein